MSCQYNARLVKKAARDSVGIFASEDGYLAGRNPGVGSYLPQWRPDETRPILWLLRSSSGRMWQGYRPYLTAALQNRRSSGDDLALMRLRVEIANDLVKRAVAAGQNNHAAGIAGALAEERAQLLIMPPPSVTVGERVERIAILDQALALLRLKRVINEHQYQSALIDTVCRRQLAPERSRAPVTWLPNRPVGAEVEIASEVDPARHIKARYRVTALDEPITSNTSTGEANPEYDMQLQPRQRKRAASLNQIEDLARKLEPEDLLKLHAGWGSGPPIVGPDGMVESGNGRVLAMQRAFGINPNGYDTYRQRLIDQAVRFGLDQNEVAQIERPILVCERLTYLDSDARRRFVYEANASGSARMSAAEQARADASLIQPGFLSGLIVSDSDRSLAETLTKRTNAPVVSRFFELLPQTERAALMDSHGQLSTEGINRLERALFAYSMPGSTGERLARLVFEEGISVDRVGSGLKQALPKLGWMEDMIRAGQRRGELSPGRDLAVAIQKMTELRQLGLSVDVYLRQFKMFPELDPVQEQWLAQLDERRHSAQAVAKLINAYADVVIRRTAAPHQIELFKQEPISRKEALRAAVSQVEGTWVDLEKWSAAQHVMSSLEIPATRIQKNNATATSQESSFRGSA